MIKRFYSTVPKEFFYELKKYNVNKSNIKQLNNAIKKIVNPSETVLAGTWVNDCNTNKDVSQVYALWRFPNLDSRNEIKENILNGSEFKNEISKFEKDSTSIILREYPWSPIQLNEINNNNNNNNDDNNKIWNMVTYETKPGQIGFCAEGISKSFNEKKKTNTPFGVFYSEFGTLNTIVEFWPYKSDQQFNEKSNSNNSNEIINSSINNVSHNLKSNQSTKLFTLDEYINKN